MKTEEFCPVAETANLIGKKWTMLIIYNLLKGNRRFNELKACMNGISSKTLSKELSALVEEGMVERKVRPGPPVMVEYALTDMGRDLEGLIEGMRSWGSKWLSNGSPK
jgi:DNA-binding HxlR family transcriptional regulator